MNMYRSINEAGSLKKQRVATESASLYQSLPHLKEDQRGGDESNFTSLLGKDESKTLFVPAAHSRSIDMPNQQETISESDDGSGNADYCIP